jgi:hypothetical protein
MAGAPARVALTSSGLAVQRQTPGSDTEKKPAEKKDAGEVIAEGFKTVAEQASDNNPQVKKSPHPQEAARGQWNRPPGEKATGIGFGVATLGLTGGALLSDPGGRKQLEGVNLAAPLTLIPYMPLTSFKYTLPSGDSPDKRLFRFETSFKADDLINLRTEAAGCPRYTPPRTANGPIPRLTTCGFWAAMRVSASCQVYPVGRRIQGHLAGQMVPARRARLQINKSIPEFDAAAYSGRPDC